MNFLLSFLGKGLVSVFGDAILRPIMAHLDTKATTGRDIAVAGIGADKERDMALVQGQMDANRLKAAAQPQFTLLIYLIAIPPAIQAAAVYFDSLPFWTPWGAHVVGAWGVPQPPGDYGSTQTSILLSFFIVAPTVQAIKGAAAVATAAIARR